MASLALLTSAPCLAPCCIIGRDKQDDREGQCTTRCESTQCDRLCRHVRRDVRAHNLAQQTAHVHIPIFANRRSVEYREAANDCTCGAAFSIQHSAGSRQQAAGSRQREGLSR